MAIWLYEDGIGEERALLTDKGRISEARIARHGEVKAGLVASATLVKQLIPNKRAIGQLAGGQEIMIAPLPQGVSEGGSMTVEIRRAAISEANRFKLPLARPAPDRKEAAAPTLLQQITAQGIELRVCRAHEEDHFAQAGWYEVIEEAQIGIVAFDGGTLQLSVTPAMTLIDVDGELPPFPLALAAAAASADAVRRFDLQGSVGIDFPGVQSKAERQSIAEAFDAAMCGDFERTGVNGFGFLQMVKRRIGPSLLEILQHRRVMGHALDLLRRAERSRGSGEMELTCHPALMRIFETHDDWIAQLERRSGRAVTLRSDPKLAIGSGYAE
ncbi:ribonuclease [Sphingorhabdus arenilitoris]|uniref:Ribonuclease n=1 Tax=Sphingorhabdus arenilitoris TaxID=1490041 RepID=A0ABV8RHK1_9SPHN